MDSSDGFFIFIYFFSWRLPSEREAPGSPADPDQDRSALDFKLLCYFSSVLTNKRLRSCTLTPVLRFLDGLKSTWNHLQEN